MARIELSNAGGGGGGTLTLTTTGTTGASTYAAGVLNIPVYQGQLTLTTTGTSGAATLAGNTLNIPNYATGGTPAGSAGEVQFNSTPAGSFAASSNLAWDNTNARLNIGAPSSPTARLNVKGSGNLSGTVNFRLTNGSNTELMYVLDNGFMRSGNFFSDFANSRVGIGTSVPSHALQVVGISRISNILFGTPGNNYITNTSNDVFLNISNGVGITTLSSIANLAVLHLKGGNASLGSNTFLVQNNTPDDLYKIENNGKITYWATNTAAGTTGAQTINRPSGTVNFAAGATTLVVTNSLCTTSSIVLPVVRTNDATATIKNVVPGAGSFTINLEAAATAETSVGFFIIN